MKTKTIVFVTGAFVHHSGWDEWKRYFEAKGYTTHNPPWPSKGGATASELRAKHPDPAIAALTLTQVVDGYADFIKALPERPIIIGHSFGGFVTQKLIAKGLGEAGVLIHSVPPLGVIPLELDFFKSTWGPLGFFTDINKTFLMSFPQWQYAFVNGMPIDEQKNAYEASVIPESKRMARGALTPSAYVPFGKPHVPLLFIAGAKDQIIPASLNRRNARAYTDKSSLVEYKEFVRNHYTVNAPGWEEVVNYVSDWVASR
jgi:pimeloyl-ACP methyl ester carboxylesterase